MYERSVHENICMLVYTCMNVCMYVCMYILMNGAPIGYQVECCGRLAALYVCMYVCMYVYFNEWSSTRVLVRIGLNVLLKYDTTDGHIVTFVCMYV